MKPTTFRKGNIVNASGCIAEVFEIHEKGLIVKTFERVQPENMDGIEGLALNKNRLKSLGFDHESFDTEIKQHTFSSIVHSAKILQHENQFYYAFEVGDGIFTKTVNFIHEIQNIHFYIFDQELFFE